MDLDPFICFYGSGSSHCYAIYHVFVCTKTSIDDVYKWVMYIHIQLIWISLGSASRLSLAM